jgi:hypothetical protein
MRPRSGRNEGHRDSVHGIHLDANKIEPIGLRAASLDDLQRHVLIRNSIFGINVAERTTVRTKPVKDSEVTW